MSQQLEQIAVRPAELVASQREEQIPDGAQRRPWEAIYDLLADAKPGDLLFWEVLGEAVGKDATMPGERSQVGAMTRRAIKALQQRVQRTARVVPGYGYKLVSDVERLEIARKHQDRAVKEIDRARAQVTNVNLAAMEPEVRTAFELTAYALGHQAQVTRQLNIKHDRLAETVANLKLEQQVDAAERAELSKRLSALEARAAKADLMSTRGADSSIGAAPQLETGPYRPGAQAPGHPARFP